MMDIIVSASASFSIATSTRSVVTDASDSDSSTDCDDATSIFSKLDIIEGMCEISWEKNM